jgi:hypothetical protein
LKDALVPLRVLQCERAKYRRIEQSFASIADVIQQSPANLVNKVVKALRTDVEKVHHKIHPIGAVPNVFITPDTDSKTLSLRVDFHSRVERFSTWGIPKDDIVSSYDADHRGRIVDVIAEDLNEFQIFLTAHDE